MKITAHRDDPARRLPQPALGARPHRRGRGRPGRDVLRAAAAVEAYIHEIVGPALLGQDPLRDRPASPHALDGYSATAATGAEMRGISAIDIALWDLFGKATGLPIYQLLGGPVRDRDPRLQHLRRLPLRPRRRGCSRPTTGACRGRASAGPYEDLDAFLQPGRRAGAEPARAGHHRHEDLAVRPRRRGDGGQLHLGRASSTRALEPFRKIREAVGDRMEITVELHALWNLPAAMRIARALERVRTDLVRGPDPDGQRSTPWPSSPPRRACRSRLARRWPRATPSASCSSAARSASSCST